MELAEKESLPNEILDALRRARKSGKRRRQRTAKEYRQLIAAIKALYEARRLSKYEYVFYASFQVDQILEDRMLTKAYRAAFSPIEQQMREVERAHGLNEDEWFTTDCEPPEHTELNAKWSELYDSKRSDIFDEFGLSNIRRLAQEKPKIYEEWTERGRRGMRHRGDHPEALKDVILAFETNAERSAEIGSYSAAVMALSAAIEGTLIVRCLKSPHKSSRIARTLTGAAKTKTPNDPLNWRFDTLIEVCRVAGWLPLLELGEVTIDSANLARRLKRLRNLIHPGRFVKERPWSLFDQREYKDAWSMYSVIRSAVNRTHWSKPTNVT